MRMIHHNIVGCRTLRTVILIAVFAGCSGPPGPETADVTGTLTLNGSPLEGASVTFYPLDNRENSLVCQAMTDSEGRFKLSTHVGGGSFKGGIPPGDYQVVVAKLDVAAIKSTLAPPKNQLPKRYNDPATSGFTAKVISGQENNFSFELESN